MQLIARNSLLSAVCVAGLLGVSCVSPASAQNIDQIAVDALAPICSSNLDQTVTFTINTNTNGDYTSGLFAGLFSGPVVGAPLSGTGMATRTYNAVIPAGFIGTYSQIFSFISDHAGVPGGAFTPGTVDVIECVVPEPGAIAFGVIAAGSVLGLVARKRKA